MINKFHWLVQFIWAISLFILGANSAVANTTTNNTIQNKYGPTRLLLTTQDWAPYQEYKNGEMEGVALDKVKCALSKMSQPYKITMTSWSEAQLKVHSGTQHGFFVATNTQERNEYATLSDPIAQQQLYWYFGPGVTAKIDELSKVNLKFSAKFGSNKWFWLKRNGYNVVKKPRDAKVLLRLLKDREIDIALEDQLVFKSEIERALLPSDYFQSELLETKPMGVYFSNRFLSKYSGFLDNFNRAITVCN
ncbi:transporter substrate-binding domain-containing protein [Vibrio sp. ZSDE26]|uniref:Transporter substrate-binding domain-containing protein n=1 Tax=Vibrio amylolyticus TaxID=2847292 RepID=A0A9X1XLS9_9VIBR|nr:transporter substrate-binding domain-containing protein [Vibrio amylolyticus]MCK6265154.1 transporter substrate-binding domain-containing protein [Vibrio amylolyticus]